MSLKTHPNGPRVHRRAGRRLTALAAAGVLAGVASPALAQQRPGIAQQLPGFTQQMPSIAQRMSSNQPLIRPAFATTLQGTLPNALCMSAVRQAELRHNLPRGLLLAVSQVESGRPDPLTRRVEPWPWTVQAEGQGLYFASKAEAVTWVQNAAARGIVSVDTGCMQVNLFYHPNAFGSVADAFDPFQNADYAARFLLRLHAMTGDWKIATGYYHSQTPELATPYASQVERMLGSGLPVKPKAPPTIAAQLAMSWRSTLPDADSTAMSSTPVASTGNDWGTLLQPPPSTDRKRPKAVRRQ